MNIFSAFINGVKLKQFKTFKDAVDSIQEYKINNNKIEIILEEFNDYGHSDSKCNFYLLYLYENNKIEKNIEY